MFLTLEKFLDHFPPLVITRADFIKQFTIIYRPPMTFETLYDPTKMPNKIIKSFQDPRWVNREAVIDYFYEMIIEKRHHYLALFYKSFFQFKNPLKLKWNNIDIRTPDKPSHLSLQRNDTSRIMIRNLYYLEILHLTRITNTMESKVSFWQTMDNLYNQLKLEGRFFAPSSIGLFLRPKVNKDGPVPGINYHNLFYLFQAYQPKASILNPYTIKWLIENLFPFPNTAPTVPNTKSTTNPVPLEELICPKDKPVGDSKLDKRRRILTPVLSWSSYLTAFMHLPDFHHYVGIDVMPIVCQKTQFLADYYQKTLHHAPEKQVDIYCKPSEELAQDPEFLAKYHNYFDAILICPPYYDMEIYHQGQQSLASFPSYPDWLNKYWRATVNLVYQTAMPGAHFGVIINDYYDLDKNYYPLSQDLDKITKERFQLIETYYLYNRTSPLRAAKKDRTERLFLYRK